MTKREDLTATGFRLPSELYDLLVKSAKKNRVNLSKEVVKRLYESFGLELDWTGRAKK